MEEELDPIPLQHVIDSLLDEKKTIQEISWQRLSNLQPAEIADLSTCWQNIPRQKRLDLLNNMRELAEEDPLFFFEEVGRIGLADSDPQVRLCGIRLSALEESESLIPTLIQILTEEPNFELRAGAAEALGRFVYLGEIEEISTRANDELQDRLIKSYQEDEQLVVRQRALEAVSFSSRKLIDRLIEDNIHSDDEDWQASALIAMGRSANANWRSLVSDFLDHESARLRKEAAHAAGRLATADAKASLVLMATDDTDDAVRDAAIWALSEIGGSDVQEFLEELIDETSQEDRLDFLESALENLLENQFFSDNDFLLFDFDEDESLAAGEGD
jgi:HEAT repeat protein